LGLGVGIATFGALRRDTLNASIGGGGVFEGGGALGLSGWATCGSGCELCEIFNAFGSGCRCDDVADCAGWHFAKTAVCAMLPGWGASAWLFTTIFFKPSLRNKNKASFGLGVRVVLDEIRTSFDLVAFTAFISLRKYSQPMKSALSKIKIEGDLILSISAKRVVMTLKFLRTRLRLAFKYTIGTLFAST